MPYVPPPDLTDIERKDRAKLQKLFFERAVLGYAFSYSKLLKLMLKIGFDEKEAHAELQDCIIAFDTNQEEEAKRDVNNKLSAIFAENGVKGVRTEDPFGRKMDCSAYESSSSSFSQKRALELGPTFGLATATLARLFEKATTKTPYVAVRMVAVKEKEDEG